ncbi:ABC transporter substrate-binding protein [Lentibacillus sp. N15]|uniref:ABC transporter substrate-binding protein n=1 Tax=Lentibacillus songyuanensis TaxID=3136161 RepID=UPI0031BB1A90
MKYYPKNYLMRSISVLFLVFIIILTEGCAGITDESNSSDSSDEKSQKLTVSYNEGINSLDPYGTSGGEEATILAASQIYDTLTELDEGEFKPSVAKEWEQPDKNTWVFKLRDDVTFHDGSSLTAKDVKASLDKLLEGNSPLDVLWNTLDSVEATDEHTLTIKTTKPLGTMLSNLSLLYIAPADKIDDEDFFQHPIGSGPFQVESFSPEQELKLSGYEDYWGGAPKLHELEFKNIPETQSRMTSLETGEINAAWTIPNDQISELQESSDIVVKSIPSYVFYFNWFNSSRKPFDDTKVRQAMWHAIDNEAIVNELFGDSGERAKAPIPSTAFGYSEQEPYDYDPELAKELLADAGYPDGFETSMMWSEGGGPQIRELAETMISYWEEIGVKVEPIVLERAEWIDKLNALDWDMNLQTNAVKTGDADYTLGRLYTSEANRNGYKNEKLDKILNGAKESTDLDEREELYAKANKIIWEDAVGIFPVELNQVFGVRENIKGFKTSPSASIDLSEVSIE